MSLFHYPNGRLLLYLLLSPYPTSKTICSPRRLLKIKSVGTYYTCRSQKGEDARLYEGVKALSDFCCAIHVNVPTGKDSLSLTQQYPNGEKIIAPGTVIVSAGGEVSDVKKVVSPVLVNDKNSSLYHIDFSFDEQRLGGSAFAQSLGKVGSDVPTVKNPEYFVDCFNAVQELINRGWVMAGHDISAGGLITTLLEMTFANVECPPAFETVLTMRVLPLASTL